MNLKKYKQKRDFRKTPEPQASIKNNNQKRFVVQRHQASNLHYDLRLEIDGVLKSWAVPKGPSMQAKIKRLAIQTEDHPVDYLTFEGTIPKGNYGAGEISIWDNGHFKIKPSESIAKKQWKAGSLKIVFTGKKLKGQFTLVKTNKDKTDHWLLIKKNDKYATDKDYKAEDYIDQKKSGSPGKVRKMSSDDFIKPMLASPKKKIFNNSDWIYELKWDGYRMISSVQSGKVKIYSRNGHSFTNRFSKIAKALEGIPHETKLDGEVVALDKNGKPNFQAIQNYPENNWREIYYYVFDVLFLNGHSTRDLKLTERKSLIPDIIDDCENIRYCDHVEGMGNTFYKKAIDSGMEGVVAKKANSVYRPGYRSKEWLKIKAEDSQEAIICGYTDSDADTLFGSLILGVYENKKLIYIGNCGTGFSEDDKKKLIKKFKLIHRKTSPFPKEIDLNGRHPNWLTPKFIAEVYFSEWTKTEKLRHPVFKALRQDKNVKNIKHQKEVKGKPEDENEDKKVYPERSFKDDDFVVDGVSLEFSNLDKTYWPETGLRKYDLIDYYLNIADTMLPYLKDRPQNLHRHPDGINNKGFYQKDIDDTVFQPWMETTSVYSESNDKDIEYLLCQNEATLLYMANLGCIEINPWNSRTINLNKPDYTVIDLDPSEKNTFDQVIEVAQATKSVLDDLKIKGYCKTSGSSGLHIFLPLGAEYTYEEARDFTKLLCLQIQKRIPKLTTLERAKKKRKNRIYLDYLQNRKSQTIAAPYCVRPKKNAPISAPLSWSEVKKGLSIEDFTIKNMRKRLDKKGDLFVPVLKETINMENVLNRLKNYDA